MHFVSLLLAFLSVFSLTTFPLKLTICLFSSPCCPSSPLSFRFAGHLVCKPATKERGLSSYRRMMQPIHIRTGQQCYAILAAYVWRTSVTRTRTHLIYLSLQTTRVADATATRITCPTISTLSHHLCLCTSLSTPLLINAAHSATLMEAGDFLLNNRKFLPHYTVFLIVVSVRTSNLITWELPPCVPGNNANEN